MFRRLSLATALLGIGFAHVATAAAQQPDAVLFRFSGEGLYDGAFGPLQEVEVAAQSALRKCGSEVTLSTSGRMDLQAQKAFAALSKCPQVSPHLDPGSEARSGAVTTGLWALLVRKAPPSAGERARTMMLTFEATDYTALEWNFCQSRPLYDPPSQPVCYSNDPNSFITWGPNGATAGGGREVQAILRQIEATDPAVIQSSFGSRADAIRRLLRLRVGPASRDVELYLCGIWAAAAQRAAWRDGFKALGESSDVRNIYDRVYRSRTFDGGKIDAFAHAYQDHGLTPSEIDFAFFKDRAAHMSVSYEDVSRAMADVAGPNVEHWRIRQVIALRVRPSSQREDRLGRDVAFYVDGLGAPGLNREEASAWRARGRRRASDVGLTDSRPSDLVKPEPAIDTAVKDPVDLTPGELAACPDAVIHTQRP